MKWTPGHRLRFGLFRTSRQIGSELDEEIEFHLEMRRRELVEKGFSPPEARSEALRLFGDHSRTRGVCYRADLRRERKMHRSEYFLETLQDVRHAFRLLSRRPAFAATLIVTLAVGIGATTAVFSTADHLLLRSLPYDDPGSVVTLWESDLQTGEKRAVAPGNFLEWKERSTSFAAMGLADPWGYDLVATEGRPEEIGAWRVSDGFLEALGVSPILGRGFVEEEFVGAAGVSETDAGSGTAVLVSRHFWQTRYGSDPGLLGRTIVLNRIPTTVVGVLSEDIEYPQARDLWVPKIFVERELRERTASYMHVVARLRPGVAMEQAQDEMDRVAADLAAEYPATNADTGIRVVALNDQVVGEVRPALLVLLGAVAFVLLVACTNVASLLLARNATRQRELGIRAALGAGRARLARQLVTESLVIGTLGGVLGVGLASLGLEAIVALSPADLPRKAMIGIDARILAFGAAVALLSALLAGLVPALQASRATAVSWLRSGDRSSTMGRAGTKLRSGLVVVEVGLAVALLIGAGLLGRSFASLLQNDLGFESRNRATLQAFLWDNNPTPVQRFQSAQRMLEGMEAIPGVERAALATAVPFHPYAMNVPSAIVVEDRAQLPSGQQLLARSTVASSSFFDVMEIPLLKGRSFTERDRGDAPFVAVINETLARRFFPDEDPIGRKVTVGVQERPREREIIGIVADVRSEAFDSDPQPEVFIPFAQNGNGSAIFVVHTAMDAASLLPQLRALVWEVDPGQAIYHSETLQSLVDGTLVSRRFNLVLLGSFSVMALLLAAIGVYGLISFSASRRTHEIGIRMALGAQRAHVVGMILGQGVKLGLAGVGLGLGLAFLLSRFMEHMLYGVEPTDLGTFAALGLFMLALTVVATYLPARRAAGLDPVRALRDM